VAALWKEKNAMFKQKLMKSAVVLSISLAAAQASSPPDHARQTLQDIRESAYNVENESDKLRMFATNTMIGNEARADLLNEMQLRINRIGKEIIATLEAERSALAPWEQQALDQTIPLLQDAAANTQQVINYFNDRKDPVWIGQYRDDTTRIMHDTEKVVAELSDSLKAAKH
jgi:CBS-domain-containing membrane protein